VAAGACLKAVTRANAELVSRALAACPPDTPGSGCATEYTLAHSALAASVATAGALASRIEQASGVITQEPGGASTIPQHDLPWSAATTCFCRRRTQPSWPSGGARRKLGQAEAMGQIEALGKLRFSWLRIACNGQDVELPGERSKGRLAGAQAAPAALARAELLIQRSAAAAELDRA